MARSEPRRIHVACGEFRPRGLCHTSRHFAVRFLGIFWSISVPFWLHFEPRGVPGDPPEALCGAPVPQDPPKCNFGVILGAPWDTIWHPVGTSLGLWIHSGGFGEAFWQHFWSIRSPLGFDVILGPEK